MHALDSTQLNSWEILRQWNSSMMQKKAETDQTLKGES